MNYIFAILFTLLLINKTTQTNNRAEPDSQIQSVSAFLIDLISQYDQSGEGAIPISRYPRFLTDVLIKGHLSINPDVPVSEEMTLLLLNATTNFVKKYNTTEVGVQDFYFDLIKDFTTFLLQNQEAYSPVINTFFGDTPFSDSPNTIKEQVEENINKKVEQEQEQSHQIVDL